MICMCSFLVWRVCVQLISLPMSRVEFYYDEVVTIRLKPRRSANISDPPAGYPLPVGRG